MTHNMTEHSHKNFPALKNSTDRHCRRRRRQMAAICKRSDLHASLASCSHPKPSRKTGRTPLASNNSAHWRCGRCRKQTTELRTRKGRRRSRCASKAATKAHTKQPPPFPFPPSPCHPLPLHPGHCEVTHAGHPIEKQGGPGFASCAGQCRTY